MSTLNVEGIKNTAATSDAITFATDGTCTAKITNTPPGSRRININGDMRIAQRSTSTATGDGVHTVDRMVSNRSGGTCQQGRSALSSSDTGPWEKGFKYSFKLTNTGSSGSEAAYREIQYRFEGQDLNAWNHTSTSSYITVSFWAKSSVAGTYYLWLRSKGGTNKAYSHSYTLAANTWKKVSFTTPGASNVVINNDTVADFQVNIAVDWGTDYTDAGTSTGSWATFVSGTRLPNFAQDWTGTANATFEVTGLQVETGSTPSDYEFRSYGDELLRCQRYYEHSYNTGIAAGSNSNVGGYYENLTSDSGGNAVWTVEYKVQKRAVPTMTFYRDNGTSGSWDFNGESVSAGANTVNGHRNSQTHLNAYMAIGANWDPCFVYGHWTSSAEI